VSAADEAFQAMGAVSDEQVAHAATDGDDAVRVPKAPHVEPSRDPGPRGTLACGLFTSPRLAEFNGIGDPGLIYSGSLSQLGVQAVGVAAAFAMVFTLSYATFAAIKATVGIRVSAEDEEAGLDIAAHGMYGYPEQFIPQPELGYAAGTPAARPAPAPQPVTAEATA
jgi:ammonium transporter, Amt family